MCQKRRLSFEVDDQPYALKNKYILSWLRKLEVVVVHRSESGRLFHMVGAETLKALQAIFVFVRGMTRDCFSPALGYIPANV